MRLSLQSASCMGAVWHSSVDGVCHRFLRCRSLFVVSLWTCRSSSSFQAAGDMSPLCWTSLQQARGCLQPRLPLHLTHCQANASAIRTSETLLENQCLALQQRAPSTQASSQFGVCRGTSSSLVRASPASSVCHAVFEATTRRIRQDNPQHFVRFLLQPPCLMPTTREYSEFVETPHWSLGLY